MNSNRECGDCAACCTVLGVVELQKKENITCKHLCKTGCGIYASRPQTCASYRCGWLDGALGPLDRPDKSGIIMDVIHDRLHVREVWQGAFDKPSNRKVARKIYCKAAVFLLFADGRRKLVGPPGKVNELVQKVAEPNPPEEETALSSAV